MHGTRESGAPPLPTAGSPARLAATWYRDSRLTVAGSLGALHATCRCREPIGFVGCVVGIALLAAGGAVGFSAIGYAAPSPWGNVTAVFFGVAFVLIGIVVAVRGLFQLIGSEEIRVEGAELTNKRIILGLSDYRRVDAELVERVWPAAQRAWDGALGSVVLQHGGGYTRIGAGLDPADALRLATAINHCIGLDTDDRPVRRVPRGHCAVCDTRLDGLNEACECGLRYCERCVPAGQTCAGCGGTVTKEYPVPDPVAY